MELVLNGERKQVPDDLTVAELLKQLSVRPELVVVEVNLTVLKRDQLASAVLKAGDQVEIVHFVGGGSDRRQRTEDRGQISDFWSDF